MTSYTPIGALMKRTHRHSVARKFFGKGFLLELFQILVDIVLWLAFVVALSYIMLFCFHNF